MTSSKKASSLSEIVKKYNTDNDDIGLELRLNACLINGTKLAYYAEMVDFECSPISPRLEIVVLPGKVSDHLWFFPENIVLLCQKTRRYQCYPSWEMEEVNKQFKKKFRLIKPVGTIMEQDEYVGWFVNNYELISLQGVTQLLAKLTQQYSCCYSKEILTRAKNLYRFLDSDALNWTLVLYDRSVSKDALLESFDGGEFLNKVLSGEVRIIDSKRTASEDEDEIEELDDEIEELDEDEFADEETEEVELLKKKETKVEDQP